MVDVLQQAAVRGATGMGGMGGFGDVAPEERFLVIAQYRDDALRLARRLTRSTQEAEDLAHTALLNVLRRSEFIVDETKVRSYLLTAVRNVWRNQLRSQSSRRTVGSDVAELIPADEVEPEDQVLTGLDAAVAGAAYAGLSDTSRDVIRLRYVDGLDYHSLAKVLGITPVAARQRAHRAREELISACMEVVAESGEGKCRQVRARLGRYHRGLLTRKVRTELARHLDGCTSCRVCYEQVVDLYAGRLDETRKH